MADYTYRSDEIVSLSITEILLIIIFGLVLVAHIINHKLEFEQKRSLELDVALDEIGQLTTTVEEITELLGHPPFARQTDGSLGTKLISATKEMEKVEADLSDLLSSEVLDGKSLPEVWTELVKSVRIISELKSRDANLLVAAESLSQENKELLRREEELSAKVKGLQDTISKRGDEALRDAVARIVGLEFEKKELLIEKKDLTIALIEKGFGKQPCWTDDKGNIEYLMEVGIGEDTLFTKPIFPGYRDSDLATLPIVASSLDSSFTAEQFFSTFYALYQWGKASEMDCRFFVRIVDGGATSREGYLTGRRSIERVFFVTDPGL